MEIIYKDNRNELSLSKRRKKKKIQEIILTDTEAKQYLKKTRRAYRMVGLGVWSILAGVASLLTFGGPGLFTMFLGIAIGVGLFIFSGVSMDQYEELEGIPLRLEKKTYDVINQQHQFRKHFNHFGIAGGIGVILLAVGALVAFGMPVGGLLFFVGLGVNFIVSSSAQESAFSHLLSKGDYSKYNNYDTLGYANPTMIEGDDSVIEGNATIIEEPKALGSTDRTNDKVTAPTHQETQDKSTSTTSNPEFIAIEVEAISYLSKIVLSKSTIEDPTVLSNIDEIIDLTNKILYRLKKDPSLIPSTRRMFDYYLPTTVKLVANYSEVKKHDISGDNINQMISKIEEALSNLTVAYKSQLEKLYLHTSIDIEGEIFALNTMLKNEGLIKDM